MELNLPDVVQLAIPFFIGLVCLEILIWCCGTRVRYETRDTASSLLMGVGNLIHAILKGALIGGAVFWVWEHRAFDLGTPWWVLLLALIVDDFIYYWKHRLGHERRWFWAAHVVHHSSQHYNLSTALRQTWSSAIDGLFVLGLPAVFLGFHPSILAFVGGINLVYQFWIHTEAIDRLGPLEWILNTPSHHRAHHGNNPRYLDANYGGIFIVWDRIFGTFVPEDRSDPPRYGLVHQLNTFNPLRIAFHEYADMFRDLLRSRSFREVWGYTFGPPGWSDDGSRMTARDLKLSWRSRRL